LTIDWRRQNYSGDDPEQHPAILAIKGSRESALIETGSSNGEVWAVIRPDQAIEVLTMLRDDPGLAFDYLSDVTAVHWPGRTDAEFDVVYQLYSLERKWRFRVKVPLGQDEEAESVVKIWATAEWLEREVYDMFGIRFAGHPDQRRILNPEGFEGHPLRKEFPVKGRVRW
jgi:NADH-quinone oxidoreductase subunit C